MALLYEFMNEDRNFGRRTGSLLESKTDQEPVQEFRLRKEEICLVCEIVREDMKCVGGRSLDLKTLASGSYQNCCKDFMFITLFYKPL